MERKIINPRTWQDRLGFVHANVKSMLHKGVTMMIDE